MPARTSAPFDLESLKTALPKIFDQAQNTAANHQKNYIALYKLQSEAAAIRSSVQNGKSSKLTGEKAFENVFYEMVTRVLPVKKGTTVADRTVRFMAGYAKFITEKNFEHRKENGIDEDEETTTERFLCHLVAFLLQGCSAKDKVVRFRVIQCIADIIAHLGELDEDLYMKLRTTLLERLRDKEPTVRAQAATALVKLAYTEQPDEVSDDEPTMREAVLDAMTYDTSPDVRRAVLTNIELSPETLPYLLARTRDVDPTIRKLVYKEVLEKYCLPLSGTNVASTVGFTHPRALTIAQREMIVRNGLGDREPTVKAAAAQLFGAWVDVVRMDQPKQEFGGEEGVKKEAAEMIIDDLVAFLHLFDLTEGQIAVDALASVFDTRLDLFENIEFSDVYWNDITAERTFLARGYIEKCIAKNMRERVDAMLPVTMEMAFRVQDAFNALIKQIEADAPEEEDEDEEARVRREEAHLELELIVAEMLRLCVYLDFGDELGRRRLLQIVRGMLTHPLIPEDLLPLALEVFRVGSSSEQDLIRVVVEIVHELRDPIEEEAEVKEDESMTEMGSPRKTQRLPKPVEAMTPEEKAKADATDLKCLTICIGMLERVNGTFEENVTLEGILGELIVPSVKRREMALREKGLICLGLCCLIARRMALGSFQLFIGQVVTAPEVIKIRVMQIIFDVLMVHETSFFGKGAGGGEQVVDFLLQRLEAEDDDRVQSLLCMGIAKLMLAGIVTDERVLQTLVIIYISPETADNQELRQCLAHFFPVYSYSSLANQMRMRMIFIPLYERLAKAYREWEGEEGMVTPSQISLMFVDWTDPVRASEAVKGLRKNPEKDPIHLQLATDIVKALFSVDYDKDEKKVLYQMLGKLNLPDEADDDKVRILKLLVVNLRSLRPPRDTVAKNALTKLETALSKKYEKQLENFSEEDYRKLEELKDLFEFLDDIIPLDDDDEEVPKKGRKRRSTSVATEASTSSAATSGDRSPTPMPRGKGKAKRRRLSQSDDESDDDNRTETSRASPVAATRAMPRRNAAEKSKKATTQAFQSIVISSDEEDGDEDNDDDEDDDEDNEATPVAKPTKKANSAKRAPPPRSSRSSRAKQEAEVDEDIDDMLEGNMTKDSIMDSSEDEEDEEVDNLL